MIFAFFEGVEKRQKQDGRTPLMMEEKYMFVLRTFCRLCAGIHGVLLPRIGVERVRRELR